MMIDANDGRADEAKRPICGSSQPPQLTLPSKPPKAAVHQPL